MNKNEERTASFFAQPGILVGKLLLFTTIIRSSANKTSQINFNCMATELIDLKSCCIFTCHPFSFHQLSLWEHIFEIVKIFFVFFFVAVIGGAVVGLLCAILVVMFIVYRMRKKDEGSYALDEPKRSPTANSYAKSAQSREFYAWKY
jgi:hypothetical protein